MAIPRVFVSSTCYDLRYVRENLVFFIGNMGFEPVLSEEGTVFYDPTKHVQDACLAEVANCQMFVLIIGGRLGSKYKDRTESIVNYEYREAVNKKIPVFAMVEQQVHAEYRVYQMNKENKSLDASRIAYTSIDSPKIFEFMEEVQGKAINNALVPFSDYSELESYLQQQWAGMMFSFLTQKSESERVANTLETLSAMSSKIEFLSRQILSSVGKDFEKLNARMYEIVERSPFQNHALITYFTDSAPEIIIREDSLEGFLKKSHYTIIESTTDYGIQTFVAESHEQGSPPFSFTSDSLEALKKAYLTLREELLGILSEVGSNPQSYLEEAEKRRSLHKK